MGKIAELQLGFGAGAKGFKTSCEGWGVEVTEAFAQGVVEVYRESHSKVVQMWRAVEKAAVSAARRQSGNTEYGVRYYREGDWLLCELPNKRVIKYTRPRIVSKQMPWKDRDGNPVFKDCVQVLGINSRTKKWEEQYPYGGLLVENIVQGIARDVMTEAMIRVENAGFPVVLTVHDEVVCEVPKGDKSLEEFNQLMTIVPKWAKGCPIAAEAWVGDRYKK